MEPAARRRRPGPLVAFTALVLTVTGFALAPAYEPTPAHAHASVRAIQDGALGWVRAVHHWAATLLVALAMTALAWAWTRRTPTAATHAAWLPSLAAFAAAAALFLTGGILAWDQHAWESLEHTRPFAAMLGIDWSDPEDAPLTAVFWAHVLGLPLLGLALLVLASKATGDWTAWKSRARLFAQESVEGGWPVAFLAAALAWTWPPRLGVAPLPAWSVSRPDWPFLWLVPFENALGVTLGVAVGLLLLAAMTVPVPYWARRAEKRARLGAVLVLAAAWAALSLWGGRA